MTNFLKKYFFSVFIVFVTQIVHASEPQAVSINKNAVFNKKDCMILIRQQEQQYKIPAGLLAAIAKVESGFGPYAVNSNGKSKQFKNLQDAKFYVTGLRNQGIIDINIGALQINYAYHKTRFSNAAAILDPYQNISYAAKYLASLRKTYGSWVKAVKFYHSPVSKYQDMNISKVMCSLKGIDVNTYHEINEKKVSLKPSRTNVK